MFTRTHSRTVYRSAITGRFVSKAYAEKYPAITIKQSILIISKPR